MGEHWYYNNLNYPPPGVPDYNYQVYPQEQHLQNQQWLHQTTSQYIQCPPVPSYPPPVAGPYSVPPPNIAPQVNYECLHNCNVSQVNQNHFYEVKPPNDYTKELENYKYIKSKIGDDTLGSKKTRESMDPNGNGASSSKEVIMIPKTNELECSEDLDFVYGDSDTHANEIAEFYSYSEHADFHLNLTAFEELVNPCSSSNLSWRELSTEQKCSVIMKILDQLEFSNRERRMKSARCILYIAQGGWLGIKCEAEQLKSAKENCFLLYKLGAFSAFVDLLNLEIDMNTVVNKASISLVDSENLRVILSVLYTISEVIRCGKKEEPALYKAFCSEIMSMEDDDLIIIKLFTMLTKFCSGASPQYPVKKILLLLWKLVLIGLGDSEELEHLKAKKRKCNGLPPEKENAMEIMQKMRPSSPPTFPPDLLEDQNQRRKRNLVKQSSLDENETIEMDLYENEEINIQNKEISHLDRWQDFNLFSNKQKDLKLPWTPKSNKREIDSFLNIAREKFVGFSLEGDYTSFFGLPQPIHDSVNVLKEHIFTSLAELEIQREENIDRNPFTTEDEIELNSTELLYQAMFPNLPQYMICLLKILLATTSRVKTTNDSINLLGDVLPKEMPTAIFQSLKLGIDVNRHKEIIVKAVSAILLLLLKHFKLNHIYQFEFMSQHLVFANCIPLILKFFNQEVINFVKAGNCIPLLDFPFSVLGDSQLEITGGIEIGCGMEYCWRNIFSSINLLRVLNKLCKWKDARIMMLVIFKSAPILKRTLKIRQAMAQLYVLKLLKMQSKYLGRNWRKANLKTVSLIYQKVRHHLNDDWAYGNYLEAKPWDFQSEEITLRTAVDKFNNRRYAKNIDVGFEPVDSNIVSVLGHESNLSDSFHKNYYLWLEDEVFTNKIQWDDLF